MTIIMMMMMIMIIIIKMVITINHVLFKIIKEKHEILTDQKY